MRRFQRYIGIDYSGAATADTRLPGLRVCMSGGAEPAGPVEVRAPQGGHWTRRELARWLADRLAEPSATLVGIDHAMGLPCAFLDAAGWPHEHAAVLQRFAAAWPLTDAGVTVADVRAGRAGTGGTLPADARWRRAADRAVPRAKSVFHFGVPGAVASSTHAGLPWLAWLRDHAPGWHLWPMDGFDPPRGAHVIAEAYPALVRSRVGSRDTARTHGSFDAVETLGAQAAQDLPVVPALRVTCDLHDPPATPDRPATPGLSVVPELHLPPAFASQDLADAWSIAAWAAAADAAGRLDAHLRLPVPPGLAAQVRVEGWILGADPVPGHLPVVPLPRRGT